MLHHRLQVRPSQRRNLIMPPFNRARTPQLQNLPSHHQHLLPSRSPSRRARGRRLEQQLTSRSYEVDSLAFTHAEPLLEVLRSASTRARARLRARSPSSHRSPAARCGRGAAAMAAATG